MFHVGSARSALFNWAIARQQEDGVLILRIEDTDAERNRPEWTEGIIRAMSLLGIEPSDPHFEGPYFQSHMLDNHRELCERLFKEGHAYYEEAKGVEGEDAPTGARYDKRHRDAGLEWAPGRALRFRAPDEGVTVVRDRIRGDVEFPNTAIEDFVIARGDGSPLFVLANVADDIAQGVTHVIRGEEHLSNTPKQQLIWSALGHRPPVWAHLPVIVNEKRQKLSKRRDKVSLEMFLEEGYLPEAMVNYLMLLGWAPGDDREIMPFDAMVPLFRLEDVNSSSAFFDEKKLRAFNGEYIRALEPAEFAERCRPWLREGVAPWPAANYDDAVFTAIAPLAQSRIAVLSEIVPNVDFLFLDEPVEDEQSWKKAMKPVVGAEMIAAATARFADSALPWEAEALKTALEETGAELGLKLGKAQAPVRVAITGRTVGLPLFESLELLGRERVLRRLRAAGEKLAAQAADE